jgi:hypothetical protein
MDEDDQDRLAELEDRLEDAMADCRAVWNRLAAACAVASRIELELLDMGATW